MPGIKRKASNSHLGSTSSLTKTKKDSLNGTGKSRSIKGKELDSSDNDSEFDDAQDLLANASQIQQDESDSGSSQDDEEYEDGDEMEEEEEEEEEEEGEDESAWDGSTPQNQEDLNLQVEMNSDEDMQGGFVDLEDQQNDHDFTNTDHVEEVDGETDQDEDDGEGEEDEEGHPQNHKRKNAGLYAAPTNEEVQGLKETGELFKNNVFKLQVEEMLPTIKPSYQKAASLELVLRRLQSLLTSLPLIQPQTLDEAISSLHNFNGNKNQISIPFPDPAPKSDANYKFGFEKPSAIHLIGSWPIKCSAKRPEGIDVDMSLVMPSSLFQEKDHMNYRYFHKRAFYLSVIAAGVSGCSETPTEPGKKMGKGKKKDKQGEDQIRDKLGVDVSYQLFDDDPRRPILVLKPIKDKSDTDFSKLKASIRIHLAHERDIFNPSRLAPSRNSVRLGSAAESSQSPTPRYNAAILTDSLQLPHLVYLHSTAESCPAFSDACLLLKTWAFQRGFGSGQRKQSVDDLQRRQVLGTSTVRFLLTMMLAHLLRGEEKGDGRHYSSRSKLSNSFSSYQLFRGVLDWLGSHDFKSKPIFMKSSKEIFHVGDKIPREDFTKEFERVFVDPTGSINLFSFIPPGSLDLLQHEATKSLQMLDDAEESHFDSLFLQDRSSPVFAFDETAMLEISLGGSFSTKSGRSKEDVEDEAAKRKADYGNFLASSSDAVRSTLSRALGVRARLATLMMSSSEPISNTWSLTSLRPSLPSQLELGVILDPEQALRMVELGPSPEETEAAASFRSFWGEKAELRRFKDGRICESVVWEVDGVSERWSIPKNIMRHVLQRHHGIEKDQISFLSDSFQGLLEVHPSLANKAYLTPPSSKGFQLVQVAYDTLSRQLRSMEDLPLSLISVVPSSSGLRGTSTFVPGPLNLEGLGSKIPDVASYLPIHDVILTFESSGRWPDDLPSIQAMKAAFYEKLSDLLPQKIQGCIAQVAFDSDAGESQIQDESSLEIIMPTGFAFRARIHHERERTLLERIISDKKIETPSRRKEAQKALTRFDERFVTQPSHHNSISALSHKYPALGDTIRFVKRWLSSQMLSSEIVPGELIELLCVQSFLAPGELPPTSSVSGFIRVLTKLATWRWKEEALFVPIQTAISATEGKTSFSFPIEKRDQVETSFKMTRSSDPGLAHRVWFMATESDLHGRAWGRDKPFAAAADAIKRLARLARNQLDRGASLGPEHVKALFTPSLSHYDFLVHLNPSVLPRYAENVNADSSNWAAVSKGKYANFSAGQDLPPVLGPEPKPDFDPALQFTKLLTSLYADTFRLFFDAHGGTVLGGLWNPSLSKPRDFKVALGFSSQPTSNPATESSENSKKNKKKIEQIKLNKRGVLAEIERLGQGIVRKVEMKE